MMTCCISHEFKGLWLRFSFAEMLARSYFIIIIIILEVMLSQFSLLHWYWYSFACDSDGLLLWLVMSVERTWYFRFGFSSSSSSCSTWQNHSPTQFSTSATAFWFRAATTHVQHVAKQHVAGHKTHVPESASNVNELSQIRKNNLSVSLATWTS